MSKSIREIAAEIGVSKQAVFKKMKSEPLSTSLRGLTATVDGRLTVSVDGVKLIKQAFLPCAPSTGVDGAVVGVLEVLREQLTAKDKQIERQQQTIGELTAALENTTQSLKAAQALHAGTMQQHIESLQPITGEPAGEQKPKNEPPKMWWNRFFKTKGENKNENT